MSSSKSQKTIFTIFGLISMIGFLVILNYLGANAWNKYQKLSGNGLEIQGIVVEANADHSGKSENYYLSYEFQPKGTDRIFSREARVDFSTYNEYSYQIGTEILVIYYPLDPEVSKLKPESFKLVFSWIAFGVDLFIFLILIIYLLKRRKDRLYLQSVDELRNS